MPHALDQINAMMDENRETLAGGLENFREASDKSRWRSIDNEAEALGWRLATLRLNKPDEIGSIVYEGGTALAIACGRCNTQNPTLSQYCSSCASPLGSDLRGIEQLDAQGNATGSKIILFFCVVYLLNLTLGLDLVPDNIPLIGNFDDAGATLLAVRAWAKIQDSKGAVLRAKEIRASR